MKTFALVIFITISAILPVQAQVLFSSGRWQVRQVPDHTSGTDIIAFGAPLPFPVDPQGSFLTVRCDQNKTLNVIVYWNHQLTSNTTIPTWGVAEAINNSTKTVQWGLSPDGTSTVYQGDILAFVHRLESVSFFVLSTSVDGKPAITAAFTTDAMTQALAPVLKACAGTPTNSPAESVANDGWQYLSSPDVLTGGKKVALYLNSDSDSEGPTNFARLFLICERGQLGAYINWYFKLVQNQTTPDFGIEYRIGDDPISSEQWVLTSDNDSIFDPKKALDFIEKLEASSKFTAEVWPQNSPAVTATFDLDGLSQSIKPIFTACGVILPTAGFLGAEVQPLTASMAAALSLPTATPGNDGALVAGIFPGSPAGSAGLQAGDVITKLNKAQVANPTGFLDLMSGTKPGETVVVHVLRAGQSHDISIVLGFRPGSGNQSVSAQTGTDYLGLTLIPVTTELQSQLNLPAGATGALIDQIKSGSAADNAGLQKGDLIVGIGLKTVNSVKDADSEIIKAMQTNAPTLAVHLIRQGQPLFIGVVLTSTPDTKN